ncbi:MAG: DUF4230 domain-containing protein [Blautia wexlerae]
MESNHCGNSCRRNQCRLDIRIQVYYQPKEESIPLETTLEDAAELTTQKMIISDVFKSTKGNILLINKNKFLVQYKTMVTAGLDVKKAKIKETDDEIRITIPHCTINEDSIKIKSSDLKIYDTNFAIMSIDKEAVIEVVAEAEEKAKKRPNPMNMVSLIMQMRMQRKRSKACLKMWPVKERLL